MNRIYHYFLKDKVADLTLKDLYYYKLYINLFVSVIASYILCLLVFPFFNFPGLFLLYFLAPLISCGSFLFIIKTNIDHRKLGILFFIITWSLTCSFALIMPFGFLFFAFFSVCLIVIYNSLLGRIFGVVTLVSAIVIFIFSLNNEQNSFQALEQSWYDFMMSFLVFFIPIILIISFFEILRSYLTEELHSNILQRLNEREVLLKEVHHRVKNNMQLIVSLIRLQEGNISDKNDLSMYQSLKSRVLAMSNIHEQLYSTDDLSDINYEKYLNKLVDYLRLTYAREKKDVAIEIDCPQIKLGLKTALTLGLVINEILTNSFKYGITENKKLKIYLKLSEIRENNFRIEIGDNGPGFNESDQENSNSLGMALVNNLVEQIDGHVTRRNDDGVHYIITFEDKD